MHNGVMKAWLESSHLAGANASYIEVCTNPSWKPDSVASRWRSLFQSLPRVNGHTVEQPHSQVRDYLPAAWPGLTPVTALPSRSPGGCQTGFAYCS